MIALRTTGGECVLTLDESQVNEWFDLLVEQAELSGTLTDKVVATIACIKLGSSIWYINYVHLDAVSREFIQAEAIKAVQRAM